MEKSGDFDHTVVLGFNPDPRFLDRVLVPALRRQGVRNLVVMGDAGAIAEALSTWGDGLVALGRAWLLWPASAALRFHPKVILQAGERHVRAWIGSGNPNHCGLSRNAEVWSRFDWDGRSTPAPALRDAATYVLDRMAASAITEARRGALFDLRHAASLQALHDASPAPDGAAFLAVPGPQGAPLLEQIANRVGPEVLRVTVAVPYYDPQLRALDWMRRRWPSAHFRLWVDPRIGNLDVRCVPADVEVAAIQHSDRPAARVHAKVFELRTPTEVHLFVGSANCSVAALSMDGATAGNAEALVHLRGARDDLLLELRTEKLSEDEARAMWERVAAESPSASTVCELVSAELVGGRIRCTTEYETESLEVQVRSAWSGSSTRSTATRYDGHWLTEDIAESARGGTCLARIVDGVRWVAVEAPLRLTIERSGGMTPGSVEVLFGDQALTEDTIRAFFAYVDSLRAPNSPPSEREIGSSASGERRDPILTAPSAVAGGPETEGGMVDSVAVAVERYRLDGVFRLVARGWRAGSDGDDGTEIETEGTELEASDAEDDPDPERRVPSAVVAGAKEKLDRLLLRATLRQPRSEAERLRHMRERLVLLGFALMLHDQGYIRRLPGRVFELFGEVADISLPEDDDDLDADGITRDGLLHLIVFVAWRLSAQWRVRDPLQGGTYRVLRVLAPALAAWTVSRAELRRLRSGPLGGRRRAPDVTIDEIAAFCEDAVSFACDLRSFEDALLARWSSLAQAYRLRPGAESELVAVRRGNRFDYGFVHEWTDRRVELGLYRCVGLEDESWNAVVGQLGSVVDLDAAAPGLEGFAATIERLRRIH